MSNRVPCDVVKITRRLRNRSRRFSTSRGLLPKSNPGRRWALRSPPQHTSGQRRARVRTHTSVRSVIHRGVAIGTVNNVVIVAPARRMSNTIHSQDRSGVPSGPHPTPSVSVNHIQSDCTIEPPPAVSWMSGFEGGFRLRPQRKRCSHIHGCKTFDRTIEMHRSYTHRQNISDISAGFAPVRKHRISCISGQLPSSFPPQRYYTTTAAPWHLPPVAPDLMTEPGTGNGTRPDRRGSILTKTC